MALRQILCPQVLALRSSPGLWIITQKVSDLDLIGDSSNGTFRLLAPRDLPRQVFEHLHGTAHPGRRVTNLLQVCLEGSLVGPLPTSKGFTYLFTITDRTSR
jgi:hypothetical protein